MNNTDEIEDERMALEAIYADAFSENTLSLEDFTLSWILPADYPSTLPDFTLSLTEHDDELYEALLEHISLTATDSLGYFQFPYSKNGDDIYHCFVNS
jgi:hypothetical protein